MTIPDVLQQLDRWVTWKLVPNPEPGKKPLKVPYYVSGAPRGEQGTRNDKQLLASYEDAVAAQKKRGHQGVGIALIAGDGVVGLDFDNCVKDGEIDKRVEGLIKGTYSEISPSGAGVRAFFLGNLSSRKDNKKDRSDGLPDVEYFGDSGFVTFTGGVTELCEFAGWQYTVAPLADAVRHDYRKRFGDVRSRSLVVSSGLNDEDDDNDIQNLPGRNLGWTLNQAREYLFKVDPDCSRQEWLEVLMALHRETDGSKEGFELANEWSAQASSYKDKADVWGRWKSFKQKRDGITGKSILKLAREADTAEKYHAVDEWKAKLQEAKDELQVREKVCREIVKDVRLDNLGREQLAKAVQKRLKDLGAPYPLAQCRGLVQPMKERGENGTIDLPEWAQGWVFNRELDKFFKEDSNHQVSVQGFNASYDRYMPRDEYGSVVKSASAFVLQDCHLTTVDGAMYVPWGGSIFQKYGKDWINTYIPSLVPEAATSFSREGRLAIERMEKHVRLLASNRDDVFQTLMDFMAFCVQNPGVKIRWAVLIKGVQGDGKTSLSTLLRTVMGSHNVRNVSPNVLKRDFTSWAEGVCLVTFEELKLAGHNRHDIYNALKEKITNNIVEIHPKGKDSRDALNTVNYMGFTNHSDALPLENGDRRIMVVFTSYETRDEMERVVGQDLGVYFDLLNAAIDDHPAELRKWLLDWKVSPSFKPNGNAPMTQEKQVMIGHEVSDTEMVVDQALAEGGLGITKNLFSATCLGKAVLALDEKAEVGNGPAWNRMLAKKGFSQYRERLKWKGAPHRIWYKGREQLVPAEIREILDKTSVENEDDETFDEKVQAQKGFQEVDDPD